MEIFVVPKKSGEDHKEILKSKTCSFPGCQEIFMGTAKSKYCLEHRKKEYRKIIDEGKVEKKKLDEISNNNNQNQIIKHEFSESVTMVLPCQLEGCQEEFTIKVYPKTFLYPKYCPQHRNSFKRKMFLKFQEKDLKESSNV
jgi:hypothetical protein